MHKKLLVQIQWGVIVILVALLVAPYIANRPQSSGEMVGMSVGMMQKMYPLDNAGVAVPTISFTITKDTLDGWDVHVATSNFIWTPENINKAAVAGQGHAHLYIDGKLTVMMGPWYHIDGNLISPGKHDILISLNANDHSVFANGGKSIQTEQTLYAY